MMSKFMRVPFSIVVLLAASGCTMAPWYHQPDMPVAAEWDGSSSAGMPVDWTASSWQDFFKDKDLQALIQQALEHNKDLEVAVLNVEAARAAYGIQRADLLPTVTADGTATAAHTPRKASTTGQSRTTRAYEAHLASTAYELDLFGRVRSLSKAALEDFLATQEAAQAVQTALVAEVASVYLQWLADVETEHLTQETLAAQENSLKLIQASFDNGISSRLDVSQIQQAVASAKANLAATRRQVAQDTHALQLLLGVKDLPVLAEKNILQYNVEKIFEPLPRNLSSRVLLQRPDVQQAEHTLKSMNANIGAARAAFFPRISLTGTFGFASSELSELFTGGAAGAWSFVPSVSLPIFEGGRNWMNLRAAQARRDIAVATYEKTLQTAFREVADELAAKETLTDQVQAQEDLVAAAQKAYDLSYIRYRQGIDRFLTTLDAQRTLYSAQISVINLRRQILVNHINLYKALGGGLNAVDG